MDNGTKKSSESCVSAAVASQMEQYLVIRGYLIGRQVISLGAVVKVESRLRRRVGWNGFCFFDELRLNDPSLKGEQ